MYYDLWNGFKCQLREGSKSAVSFAVHEREAHFRKNGVDYSLSVNEASGEDKAYGVVDNGLDHEEDVKNEKVGHGHGEHEKKAEEIARLRALENLSVDKVAVQGAVGDDIWSQGEAKAH